MALTDLPTHPEAEPRLFHLRWPAVGVDAASVWADYDPIADELLVYFDRPIASVSVPIDTPDRDYVYLLVDEATEAVVGVQVDALRAWVAAAHPRWAPLADPDAGGADRRAAVAALIADAAGLFALHGAGGA
jgi:hypothetical protein